MGNFCSVDVQCQKWWIIDTAPVVHISKLHIICSPERISLLLKLRVCKAFSEYLYHGDK